MTSLADDLDFDCGYLGHDGTLTDTDVTFLEIGDIVVSVNLVNSIKTALLYHGKGTTWTLLSWLKEKSNLLTRGYLVFVLLYNFSSTE